MKASFGAASWPRRSAEACHRRLCSAWCQLPGLRNDYTFIEYCSKLTANIWFEHWAERRYWLFDRAHVISAHFNTCGTVILASQVSSLLYLLPQDGRIDINYWFYANSSRAAQRLNTNIAMFTTLLIYNYAYLILFYLPSCAHRH